MKKIAIIACVCCVLAASMVQADFPRRSRGCSAPCYTPAYESVYTPTVVTPTVTTIIQEPLPVFVFQNLTGYGNLPPSAVTPQQQYGAPPAAQQPLIGNLSDRDIDRLANAVLQRLQASQIQNTGLLVAPPSEQDQLQTLPTMTQAIANELGAKCASCHQAGLQAKSGLTLFGADRIWNPQKNGMPYADVRRIAERSEEGSMPPTAISDPSKRVSPEAVAFLKQLQ